MPKLLKRVVDSLLAAHDGRSDRIHWDDEIRGFGLRINPSGAAGWLVQYRTPQGRTRRLTLGAVGVLTPDQARKRARIELGRVEAGEDPSGERRAARNAVTVAQLCDDYLQAGKGRIKASTLAMDRSRIERHVKPLLGAHLVTALTHSDVEKFVRDIEAGKSAVKVAPKGERMRGGQTTGGSGVAARTVGMLGTILERAVRDGTIARNPARGVKKAPDKARRPKFDWEIIEAVGQAMRDRAALGENALGLRALRLLMLSGCRRNEVLGLRWAEVDEAGRCFRFGDTKSGAQVRPIGRTAMEVISVPREKDQVFVFPAAAGEGHFVGLPRVWARVSAAADLKDVPIHGLRHWFAAAAAAMGYSELIIAGLLGHAVRGVTGRYASVPDAALLSAADRVSARLAACLDGAAATSDNVVPLRENHA